MFESTNPTWGLCSLQVPLTGGKAVSDKGPLSLKTLNLALELLLLLPVSVVSLDLGVQSPVVELLRVGHQVVVPLRGTDKEADTKSWYPSEGPTRRRWYQTGMVSTGSSMTWVGDA